MTREPTGIDGANLRTTTTAIDEAAAARTVQPQPQPASFEPSARVNQIPIDQSRAEARRDDEGRPGKSADVERLLGQLGLGRLKDGRVRSADRFLPTTRSSASGLRGQSTPSRAAETLPPLPPLPLAQAQVNPVALESFAAALGRSIDDLLLPNSTGGDSFIDRLGKDALNNTLARVQDGPGGVDVNRAAADSLTAIFMKLNIDNQLDSTEMQNQLDQALSQMRKLAISEAKAKIERMRQLLLEMAQAKIGGFFLAAIIIAIIIAILVAILFTIIIAIIVALVLIIAALIVKQMLTDMAKKAIDQAMNKAMQEAIKQIDDQVAAERQKRMEEIAAASLVGPDGQPIRSDAIRTAVQPKLALALGKVLDIAASRGMDAARAEGPQIIHDDIYPELLALGIPPEKADQLAWAITEEAMLNLAEAVQPAGSVPVNEHGEPLSDEEIKERLTPALVTALAEVTRVADAEGAGAAAARGPQIIHDALIDELKAMGLSDEYADRYAWAIAEEAMNELNARVQGGAAQPQTESPGATPPPAGGTGGRDPSNLLTGAGGLMAALDASFVDSVGAGLLASMPTEVTTGLAESVAGRGVAATLQDALAADDSMAPTAMLGLGAIFSGGIDADKLDALANGGIDLRDLATFMAESKDRALQALVQVGGHSHAAEAQLQRPFNV